MVTGVAAARRKISCCRLLIFAGTLGFELADAFWICWSNTGLSRLVATLDSEVESGAATVDDPAAPVFDVDATGLGLGCV